MPTKLEDIHPTRSPEALTAIFGGCVNVGSIPGNVDLKAFGVKIRHGEHELWLTRVEGLRTYHHLAAQTLELALEPQVAAWVGGESCSDPSANDFWPSVSNEFMAKCFCGDLSAARELFMAIEAEIAGNPGAILPLLRHEAYDEEFPLQIYLHEFEPEGLGVVHFTFGDGWDGPLQALEDRLRANIPHAFAKLPGLYESTDFFGTYDWYCSENFIAETSPEMAVAAWRHCIDQDSLRDCLTPAPGAAPAIMALLARAEAGEIGEATSPGAAGPKALRV